MSGYGSLFERLAGDADERIGMGHEECVVASVAAHLAKMLSTRAGSVQTLPDYGLPDLNDMSLSLHDSLTQARQAIENFIALYEPRLNSVKVTSTPRESDPFRLFFAIEGVLEVAGVKRPIRFSAALNGSGQVMVT
ncbi:type VI secretion system baseplate subunit TssE [Pseudomonas caspiana]|uniref:type VI secretion system baseplate subunit TssE n=1 Tax=Pseudomonas caspiana TaxID=1451454 RepID=UPI0032F00ECB